MSATLLTGAPGVYSQEINLDNQIVPTSSTIVGFAYPAKQGPMGITLVTTPDRYKQLYGQPTTDWGYGPRQILEVLNEAKNVYIKRVVSDNAFAATAFLTNDIAGSNATRSFLLSSTNGARVNTVPTAQQQQTLTFSGPLVTLNSIALTITDGTTVVNPAAIVFNTDNDTTLKAIATAINTAFVSTYNGANLNPGFATVLSVPTTTSDDRSIFVLSPEGKTMTITAAVTLGASQATMTSSASTNVLTFYAENPGAWANDVGIKITNINFGVQQRLKLTFSAALVASNSVTIKLNSNGNRINVPVQTFVTDSDTTMANIAAAIKTALGGQADCFVTQIASGTANDRDITIVAPVDGPSILSFVEGTVTGGASQATITAVETLAGIKADDTFVVEVYTRSNQNTPVEKYTVSLKSQLDGFANQQFIEEVINNSEIKSPRIRVSYNATNASGLLLNTMPSTITWLSGGANGDYPSDSKIVTGWDSFSDPEQIRVSLLFSGGYTGLSVLQKIASIPASRKDCHAILDVPSANQVAADADTFRRTTLNVDSRYVSIFTPDVQILDTTTDSLIYLPPSGKVCARFVWTDNNAAIYEAPAGLTRGLLSNVVGLRYYYSKGERDVLEAAQINPLRRFQNGAGIAIYGDNTLQVKQSLTSAISVSRFITQLQVAITDSLEFNVFDLPTSRLYDLIKNRITSFLMPYKRAGGLRDFFIKIDESNNTAVFRDAGQMNIDFYVIPNRPAKRILLRTYITPSSITFEEIVQ